MKIAAAAALLLGSLAAGAGAASAETTVQPIKLKTTTSVMRTIPLNEVYGNGSYAVPGAEGVFKKGMLAEATSLAGSAVPAIQFSIETSPVGEEAGEGQVYEFTPVDMGDEGKLLETANGGVAITKLIDLAP